MRAIMLAFARRQQYHALRAAAAAGYDIHVLGQGCARGLKYSRYCASYRHFDFDPFSQSLDDALAEIKRRAAELSADLILPSDSISTRLLASLADRLPAPTCALPDPACFDMLNDKWQFFQFCRDNGMRVPQTRLFKEACALQTAVREGTVPFPFIVKPSDAMGCYGVQRITGEADLKRLDTLGYSPLLVQKLIDGTEVDISILANKGRIVAYAIQRNLSGKYEFIRHDPLLAQVSRIVAASGFHGLAHFDAIMEKGTGDVYLIECNPRAWWSIFAAAAAGLDFVKLSLNPQSLDPDKPQGLVSGEVDGRGSTVRLLMQVIKERGANKANYNFLKYSLADPEKKFFSLNRFNDTALPPGSPGSVPHQIATLAALKRMVGSA